MVARGLKGWPFADAAAGRRVLRRAADAALAWQGATRRIAARRGAQLPGWVRAQTLPRPGPRSRRGCGVQARPAHDGRRRGGGEGGSGRLAALGYLQPGYAPGVYDYPTMQATIALQGWEGIARDGVAGPSTLRALRTAARPVPWSSDTRHMEVHKAQQVLLLVENGTVVRAIHVSTAAPGHVTPDGTFTIYRKERMSWSVPFQCGCLRELLHRRLRAAEYPTSRRIRRPTDASASRPATPSSSGTLRSSGRPSRSADQERHRDRSKSSAAAGAGPRTSAPVRTCSQAAGASSGKPSRVSPQPSSAAVRRGTAATTQRPSCTRAKATTRPASRPVAAIGM